MIPLIRRLYYMLFFLAPLVMFSGTSELFEFNKMMLIYVFSILIITLFLVHCIIHNKKILSAPFLGVLYLIFFGSQLLSTLFSIDIHTSLFGYYGRFNGGLLSIIAYISLFFVFIRVFDRKSVLRLLQVSLAASIIVITWGLPGRFGYDLSCLLFTGQLSNECWTNQFQPAVRMFSTLGQPNWLGAYLVIHFFIGLYFWAKHTLSEKKITSLPVLLYSLYLITVVTAILFTKSRSSLGALALLLGLFPVIYFFTSKRSEFSFLFKKYCVILALFLIPIVIFKTGVNFVDRFITLPNKATPTVSKQPIETAPSEITGSFDIRKVVWKGAVDLALKYPVFGSGVETFAYAYYFTRPAEHNLTSEWDFLYNKAHNEYLNYVATTGVVGLAAYLILIGYVIVLLYRSISIKENQEANQLLMICLLLAYISILITNFFGFSTTTINLFFYTLPGFIIGMQKSEVLETVTTQTSLTRLNKIKLGCITVVCMWLLLCVFRYYAADIQYAKADGLSDLGEYGQAAIRLQKALSLHTEHVYKDKMSFALANIAFITSYQNESSPEANVKKDQNSTDTYIGLAQFFNADSLRQSPKNVLYKKTTSKNNYLFYQIYLEPQYLQKALQAITEAQTLAPTDPKLPYTAALFHSLLADEVVKSSDAQKHRKQSLVEVDRSITLKSDYRDAYFLKGQLLKKYDHPQEAHAIFEYILKNFDPRDQDVFKELQ